jgi:hypothetical protein
MSYSEQVSQSRHAWDSKLNPALHALHCLCRVAAERQQGACGCDYWEMYWIEKYRRQRPLKRKEHMSDQVDVKRKLQPVVPHPFGEVLIIVVKRKKVCKKASVVEETGTKETMKQKVSSINWTKVSRRAAGYLATAGLIALLVACLSDRQ